MSERLKEHDWKSCVGQKPTGGSNPPLCAKEPERFKTSRVLLICKQEGWFEGRQVRRLPFHANGGRRSAGFCPPTWQLIIVNRAPRSSGKSPSLRLSSVDGSFLVVFALAFFHVLWYNEQKETVILWCKHEEQIQSDRQRFNNIYDCCFCGDLLNCLFFIWSA